MNKWVRLLVTYFFGIFGIHKFMDKQYGLGVLYLCTCGLFTVGWIYDVIKAFTTLFNNKNKGNVSKRRRHPINHKGINQVVFTKTWVKKTTVMWHITHIKTLFQKMCM